MGVVWRRVRFTGAIWKDERSVTRLTRYKIRLTTKRQSETVGHTMTYASFCPEVVALVSIFFIALSTAYSLKNNLT